MGPRGCRTVLNLRLVLRMRLAVVVDCVTVHGRAGVVANPTEHLRAPGAAVGERGVRGRREGGAGGFMAAMGPDSVGLRQGL